MVRLKGDLGRIADTEMNNFNSTMVRLKVVPDSRIVNVLDISIPLWFG